MEKGWKRLILVAGCLLFGCLLGYFVTVTQAREQDDPAYLAFFEEGSVKNFSQIGLQPWHE